MQRSTVRTIFYFGAAIFLFGGIFSMYLGSEYGNMDFHRFGEFLIYLFLVALFLIVAEKSTRNDNRTICDCGLSFDNLPQGLKRQPVEIEELSFQVTDESDIALIGPFAKGLTKVIREEIKPGREFLVVKVFIQPVQNLSLKKEI